MANDIKSEISFDYEAIFSSTRAISAEAFIYRHVDTVLNKFYENTWVLGDLQDLANVINFSVRGKIPNLFFINQIMQVINDSIESFDEDDEVLDELLTSTNLSNKGVQLTQLLMFKEEIEYLLKSKKINTNINLEGETNA